MTQPFSSSKTSVSIRGSYVLVRDPDRLFRPWVSSFPWPEIRAGLQVGSWRPGTVFWHQIQERYYIVTNEYTLEEIDEWDATLAGLAGYMGPEE